MPRAFRHLLSVAVALILAAPALGAGMTRVAPRSAEEMQLSFSPVVERAAPAVVNVYAKRLVRERSAMFDDPVFGRMFGDLFGDMPRERFTQSLGSGVIVRGDGVVVTNNHVIEGAQELRVVLKDRREFDARVIVADERTDLAVLRIDAEGERLPILDFARADRVLVGDLVLAIGNPFGVGQTVTSGIVSALGRSDVGATDFSFFIQTDAAINPGNSGGALVDMKGDLVGINTAIFSRSGGSIGIGFAIPSDLVARTVESALIEGKLVRPWLGARGQTVTRDIASSLGLDRPQGLVIAEIYPGGPADKAGARKGDVILSVDGVDVNDEAGARFRLAIRRIGESAKLRVFRGGGVRELTMKVAAPPESPPRDVRLLAGAHPFAGAKAANLSPAFNDELRIDPLRQGVVILEVSPRSAADYYGLRPGDIIAAIGSQAISSARELDEVTKALQGAPRWTWTLERGGRRYQQTARF